MGLKDFPKRISCGTFPDFGAIFMSNGSTSKECLQRKLFGLPAAYTDFVRRVKAGMILFLFEYEKRRLYGVFEATSDGGTNIVPDAYSSSGRQFPAQVRITTIWQCHPISEHKFCVAIEENYFAPKKFNFGLSKDQVCKLLLLFDARRLKVPKSKSHMKNEVKKWDQKSSTTKRELEDRSNGSHHAKRKLNINTDIESVDSFGEAEGPKKLKISCGNFTEEPEKLNISSGVLNDDLGDFIPLSPFDDSDTAEPEISFSEAVCFENDVKEFTGFLPKPFVTPMPNLAGQSFCQESTDHIIANSILDTSPCKLNVDSFSATFPSSEAGDSSNGLACALKSQVIDCKEQTDFDNSDKYPLVSCPYSDKPNEKSSVFCRLNLASRSLPQENVDYVGDNKRSSVFSRLNLESRSMPRENVDYAGEGSTSHISNAPKKCGKRASVSVHKMSLQREDHIGAVKSLRVILQELQHRHDKWSKKVGRSKCFEQEYENLTEKKRMSVFLRLHQTTKAGVQENGTSTRLLQENMPFYSGTRLTEDANSDSGCVPVGDF